MREQVQGLIATGEPLGVRGIRGTIFNASVEQSTLEAKPPVIFLSQGDCSGQYTGAEYLVPLDRESIIVSLEICTT